MPSRARTACSVGTLAASKTGMKREPSWPEGLQNRGRSWLPPSGGPLPHLILLFLIEPSMSRILGHTHVSNQGMAKGIVLEERGQRGQVQTGRVLDFGQGQLGLWDRPVQWAPTWLHLNIPFFVPPQGPESMVSRQEVKPDSLEPWGKCLVLEEGEDGANPGQRVAGRTFPRGPA